MSVYWEGLVLLILQTVFSKKTTLFSLLVLASSSALACQGDWGSERNKKEIVRLFDQVILCQEYKGQEAIQCVDSLMAAETSDRLVMKITKWLLDTENFGPVESCPQRIRELFPEAGRSRYLATLCSSYTLHGKTDLALLYFVREEGEIKLAGIQKMRF